MHCNRLRLSDLRRVAYMRTQKPWMANVTEAGREGRETDRRDSLTVLALSPRVRVRLTRMERTRGRIRAHVVFAVVAGGCFHGLRWTTYRALQLRPA
ncbi:hypothetical protein MRX96_050416 [Rhipicephalus microplus]